MTLVYRTQILHVVGGRGYPVYVVNATSSKHVKAGVDFARKHNIRLIVKATGHDYMGRYDDPKMSYESSRLTWIQVIRSQFPLDLDAPYAGTHFS
jgi:hypothetical protein